MFDEHPRHRGAHSRGGSHSGGRGRHRGGHDDHRSDHRGGRHRARRGAILEAVLTLLEERPMHGYELITELEDRSEGRWRPSPGTMYPALKRMSAKELISSEEVDGKRQFSLTETGRNVLIGIRENQGDDAVAPWDQGDTGGRGDLRGSIAELVGQARQIGRFGTPEQIEKASAVFEETKRKLYAILAEAPDAEPSPAPDDE